MGPAGRCKGIRSGGGGGRWRDGGGKGAGVGEGQGGAGRERRASAMSSGAKASGSSAPHATSLGLTSCHSATKPKTTHRLRQRAKRPLPRPPSGR